MAKQKAVPEGTLIHLDPIHILADDNVRFGLKDTRIASLAADILEKGGVMVPVEVSMLPEGSSNGHTHRLTTGFYRHAAVAKLNTEGAGLTLPAILKSSETDIERLKRQLSENTERENMSPMDIAVAVKRLMDAGQSRIDVRTIFSRPGGSKKGGKPQPASNSWLNIHLSFLAFPADIKKLIHTGELGVAAAYELSRLPAEKWPSVVERAQSERQKQTEREERDEEKYLKEQSKAEELAAKVQVEEKKVAAAQAEVDKDATALEAATVAAGAAYEMTKGKLDAKAKKEAQKAFQEAEKTRQGLAAKLEAATKDLTKVSESKSKVEALASEKAQKLAQARAAAPAGAAKASTKSTAVGPGDVKKAAQETGASSGHVALNAAQMRQLINELTLAGGAPKVKQIGESFRRAFTGEITDKQLYRDLCKVTGEKTK